MVFFFLITRYLFRTVRSRSRDLRVVVEQRKTCAYTVRRAFRSHRVRFDGLVRAWSGHEDTIVREDLLSTGYGIGGRCLLVALLGPAESGADVIDIRRWNSMDLFPQKFTRVQLDVLLFYWQFSYTIYIVFLSLSLALSFFHTFVSLSDIRPRNCISDLKFAYYWKIWKGVKRGEKIEK